MTSEPEKLNLDARVADFVTSYEFDADDCHHVPDENERALITDALHGFIGQHCGPIPMIAEAGEREAQGSFACPICGEEKPHHHTKPVVDAYQTKGSRK